MSRLLAGGAICVAALCAVPARAADPVNQLLTAPAWTVTLGIEPRVVPTYEGSKNSWLVPFPMIDVRRAGTPHRFRSPRDGASIGFYENDFGTFRVGPTLKLRLPRREDGDSSIQGLGNVPWAWELGGFVEYWPARWLRTRAELRQGLGGHSGLVGDVMADVVVPVTPKLTLSGGPRLTLSNAKAMDPYYSINAQQSALSGLPVFDAKGGLRAYGAGVQARYELSSQWATHMFVEYERLAGDAANAPLVSLRGTRDQFQVGIGLTYSFDVNLRR